MTMKATFPHIVSVSSALDQPPRTDGICFSPAEDPAKNEGNKSHEQRVVDVWDGGKIPPR
jgi:hypothetical protein